MNAHDSSQWQHSHDFGTAAEARAERRTRWVVALTLVMMAGELLFGWITGSMALLADGWHMGTHALALGLTLSAYAFARRRADDRRYTFGTGKVPSLAGFTSALLLGAGAIVMAVESFSRLVEPVPIRYGEAMVVAALGLAVNLLSAWLLGHDHGDRHDHHHAHHDHDHHSHSHAHHDHNLRAAYLHVLADALTSVLAIVALAAGMLWGWAQLDPLMGLVGAALVGSWAWGLLRDSALVLLDAGDHRALADAIHEELNAAGDSEVADLHLWRVGPRGHACILSVVTHSERSADDYRRRLEHIAGICHLTIEVRHCHDRRCLAA
ncbi:CDF family Co(II)/Ni(II) efflux transporter DmeF [Endothiovibrio diazotrophicus]